MAGYLVRSARYILHTGTPLNRPSAGDETQRDANPDRELNCIAELGEVVIRRIIDDGNIWRSAISSAMVYPI
jgi:hypothetical protein